MSDDSRQILDTVAPSKSKPFGWDGLHFLHKSILVTAVGAALTAGAVLTPKSVPMSDQSTPQTSPKVSVDIVNGCGMEGKSYEGSNQSAANRLKNRYTFPSVDTLDPNATLETLSHGKGASFDQARSAEIDGYVTDVKMGGTESCNCGTTDPVFMDTHIYIGKTATAKNVECVIVEVTPRIRQILGGQGEDWSTKALMKNLRGRHVRISGWLFYDKEHENAAVAIDPTRKHNWRSSCWEIHPVTSIDVLDGTGSPK